MEKEPSVYKEIWAKLPKTYKRYFLIVFIVLIISAFFSIYYFNDGLEELINMSKQVTEIK